jgi:hypothetical protein
VLSVAPHTVVADEPPRGGSVAPEPEKPRRHHPEPRVIVNVISVSGPHPRKEVERAARLAWGRIVSCYEGMAGKAKGVLELELVVAGAGKVTDARRTRSTFRNQKLESCLIRALKGLPMPEARARSIAHAEIHLAPGDP